MAVPEALAFDMYGTLVDPIRIWTRLEQYVPDQALRVSEVWRQKQLEYSFRLTVMERYEDFEQLTRKALDYALTATGRELTGEQKDALMAQYNDLDRFPDVEPGLTRLQQLGHTMVVFSNGSPRMLDALMDAAGLRRYFDGFVSVEEVRAFKPSPKTYRRVAERLGRPIGEVRLISANPFDDIGAESAGMAAAWVNRSGGLFDTLRPPPQLVVTSLTELAGVLEQAGHAWCGTTALSPHRSPPGHDGPARADRVRPGLSAVCCLLALRDPVERGQLTEGVDRPGFAGPLEDPAQELPQVAVHGGLGERHEALGQGRDLDPGWDLLTGPGREDHLVQTSGRRAEPARLLRQHRVGDREVVHEHLPERRNVAELELGQHHLTPSHGPVGDLLAAEPLDAQACWPSTSARNPPMCSPILRPESSCRKCRPVTRTGPCACGRVWTKRSA